MKIPEFIDVDIQVSRLGNHEWSVKRLIALSTDLEILNIPLDHLNVYSKYEKISLRQMVMHMNAVNKADLSFPIILDEDGEIMDGRHRIMKAMIIGEKSILAVRFDENPSPCVIHSE